MFLRYYVGLLRVCCYAVSNMFKSTSGRGSVTCSSAELWTKPRLERSSSLRFSRLYQLAASGFAMELKLVYRGLRQISDWALRFYSEVYVDGVGNVPPDGPLIMYVHHGLHVQRALPLFPYTA